MEEAGARVVRGREWRTAAAAVGATVAAVVATLAIPWWLAAIPEVSTAPRPPAPTQEPDAPGTRTWQQLRCSSVGPDTCAAPAEIDHAGVVLRTVGTGGRVYVGGSGAYNTLTVTVRPSRHNRWVLVGAEGAGSDSRLTVALGGPATAVVPPGRLSLFSLPGHRRLEVTLADLGRPGEDEVLRVQQYLPR